jgi:cold shock protein
MNDTGFRGPRRRGFDHDFPPHRARGHKPAFASAGHRQPVSGPATRATVKWFSPEKGFGFVVLGNGSGEAFLHASVVEQSGRDGVVLKPGVRLQVTVGHGQKSLQVTQIIDLNESTAARATPRRGAPLALRRAASDRTRRMTGTVKWYSPERGFGFVAVDSGGREVFVHATALQRSRIAMLSEGERVTLEVAEGRKGLEAVTIASAD